MSVAVLELPVVSSSRSPVAAPGRRIRLNIVGHQHTGYRTCNAVLRLPFQDLPIATAAVLSVSGHSDPCDQQIIACIIGRSSFLATWLSGDPAQGDINGQLGTVMFVVVALLHVGRPGIMGVTMSENANWRMRMHKVVER